jgi:hypothetical protein
LLVCEPAGVHLGAAQMSPQLRIYIADNSGTLDRAILRGKRCELEVRAPRRCF